MDSFFEFGEDYTGCYWAQCLTNLFTKGWEFLVRFSCSGFRIYVNKLATDRACCVKK